MDYPVRVYGPNVYERLLTTYLARLGLLVLAWTLALALAPGTLLADSSPAGSMLGGLSVAAGIALVLAGGGVRQNRAALDVGFGLLGLVALCSIVVAALAGRGVSLFAGAVELALWLAAVLLRRAAVRARYRPRFFSPREFETMVQIADTMIDGDGREAIDPIDIAIRVDHLLDEIDYPGKPQIKLVFVLVEWVLPLVALRPLPFSTLGSQVRRSLVTRVIGAGGPFVAIARTLKILSCAGYYGNPQTMRELGCVPFDERPRALGVDQAPLHYPDPFPGAPPRVPGAAP
jgi:hypothetical protein